MNHPTLNAILHVSDMLISEGILVHPASLPDRVSRIQTSVFEPDLGRPKNKRAYVIAAEVGSLEDVADHFGVTVNTVRTYRSRFGPRTA